MFYLRLIVFIIPLVVQCYTKENVQLARQQHIFELYLGVINAHHFPYEHFDVSSHINYFHDPELVHEFLEAYERGFLPVNGIFTTNDERTKKDTLLIFKLYYSAKDFETFYKTASWSRKYLHPVQFTYALTLAMFHRHDCHKLIVPPIYEVIPHFFTPVETMHEAFEAKMLGIKEAKFAYNNTGYVHNYHENKYGGPLSPDAAGHSESKVSYFREDIGINTWFLLNLLRYPNWMEPKHYNGMHWFKRGESMYYNLQQLFAIYTMQRLANKLPYTETLEWDKPIKVGYNPRVSFLNGRQLYYRPDYMTPYKYNTEAVKQAQMCEVRLQNGIYSEQMWDKDKDKENDKENKTSMIKSVVPRSIDEHHEHDYHYHHHKITDGTDLLGKMIFGMPEVPDGRFFGNYFFESMKALGYVPQLRSEHEMVGTALSMPATALRDPAFYQFLNRLLKIFQEHKKNYPCYTPKELGFHGVHIEDFDVDKLITYFENYEYDLTNGVPMKHYQDYDEYNYYGKQNRLNHKPYNYKIVVKSEDPKEAMVRVFIGPKYDSDDHLLTLEQSRLAYVELDRFPVKLTVGENILERSSKQSPLFSHDPESFRSLLKKVNKALKNSEPYSINEDVYHTIPERFQLPLGKKHGQPFLIAVVVTPYVQDYIGEEFYAPFGSAKLYDAVPLGFPFDRPVESSHFHVPNILFKDVLVYHKDESEMSKLSEML